MRIYSRASKSVQSVQSVVKKKSREHVSLSSEVSEYSDEEEQEGEGSYPTEEFCIPWDVADLADYFHFVDDGDGVHPGLIDGIAEELVAVFNGYVFYKDRVGFRRFQRVQGVHVIIACSLLKDVDRVVLKTAEIEGIGTNLANELSSLLCASAPDEGAEGDKR